jgi:hypothetical protein
VQQGCFVQREEMTVIADRFDFRIPDCETAAHGRHHHDDFDFVVRHHHHHNFDFVVTFNPQAIVGIFDNIGNASASLGLNGIGNVIIGDTTAHAAVSIHGGNGLTTVVLGNGNDHVD